ncbi:hypothetical protein B0I35DRAFT_125681 [Stachybotrys elegans]|uniref:Uncharacterized protein n=1 Tax=Stachybotrys elegans TaxID=80388 RepID=A0A8K0T091_9HYPO|nr:hypothetical protein B0I35DRAFT_125681 [Stachybotrys elegans]
MPGGRRRGSQGGKGGGQEKHNSAPRLASKEWNRVARRGGAAQGQSILSRTNVSAKPARLGLHFYGKKCVWRHHGQSFPPQLSEAIPACCPLTYLPAACFPQPVKDAISSSRRGIPTVDSLSLRQHTTGTKGQAWSSKGTVHVRAGRLVRKGPDHHCNAVMSQNSSSFILAHPHSHALHPHLALALFLASSQQDQARGGPSMVPITHPRPPHNGH